MTMRKIVFVDIDGTIIDCTRGLHVPTVKTIEGFAKIKARGDLVFIASGRAMCLLSEEVKDLRPSGYLLANGSYSETDGKIIFSETMSLEAKRQILNFCERYGAIYYFETRDEIFTKDLNDPIHIRFAKAWDIDRCYRDSGYRDDLPINIAMLAIPQDDSIVDEVYRQLEPYVDVNRHGSLYSFDLNIKGNSKGKGIDKIIKSLGLSKEDTYAFGDGYNDIEMMQEVKYGIGMKNGVDALKAVATDITDDVLEDGFYNGLKKYSLID